MTRYSVKSRDETLVKGYKFLFFATNMGKNISNYVSSKCSEKLFDHSKQSATDALKTASKREIQKTSEAIDNLIGNKIVDKITRTSNASVNKNK